VDHASAHSHPLQISIEGLRRGSRTFELTVEARQISGLVEEYNGMVHVEGTIHRIGDRLHVDVEIDAIADLVCDLSLEQYEEDIRSELTVEYQFDNDLASEQDASPDEDWKVKGLFEHARTIDLEDDIRQELTLALPMKRIAPRHRDQSIEDLHPDLHSGESPSDERWDALKKLKRDRT
jgi:uncharacterized metal-binding protein YceD (DUF177 family)